MKQNCISHNSKIVLKSRPGSNGVTSESNFSHITIDFNSSSKSTINDFDLFYNKSDHSALIKTLYLSVDPYQRCRFNENSGVDYAPAFQIGEVITSGGVGVIIEVDGDCKWRVGDIVTSSSEALDWPWQQFISVSKSNTDCSSTHWKNLCDKSIIKVGNNASSLGISPSKYLGAVGMPGLTALLALTERAHLKPCQTIVISGAAGAVGSVVGQAARLLEENIGKVVGICGTDTKVRFLTEELRFDVAINYKTLYSQATELANSEQDTHIETVYEQLMKEKLEEVVDNGIDVYFDNVGGAISNAVISKMKPNSIVILCGQIALYNKDVEYPPPIPEHIQEILKKNNINRERYLVLSYKDKFEEGIKQLSTWVSSNQLVAKETISIGLQSAPSAFVGMMNGANIGKQLVAVSDI